MRDGGVSGPSRAGGSRLSTYPKTIVSPGQSPPFRKSAGNLPRARGVGSRERLSMGWRTRPVPGAVTGGRSGRLRSAVKRSKTRRAPSGGGRFSPDQLGSGRDSPTDRLNDSGDPRRACGRHDRTHGVAWASASAAKRGSGDGNELVEPEIVVRLLGCVRSLQGCPERSAQVLLEHVSRGQG